MELWDVASHGVVSRRDAEAIGLDSAALRSLARSGHVRRLVRGWYAVARPGGVPDWERGPAYEQSRRLHELTTTALLESFQGRVVASHYSALLLHGLTTWRADLDTVHLARVLTDHTRRRAGAVIHPYPGVPSVLAPSGLATVPVATAIVQTGLLGATGNPVVMAMESLVLADRALHLGLVTDAEISAEIARHAGHPGITATRLMLFHRDGRHESVGETRLAHVMRGLRYAFTPQVSVRCEGQTWRLDFALDDEPVAVEFDGYGKYLGLAGEDDPRLVVVREKLREDRIRELGVEFVRVTWRELDDPVELMRRIEAARRRARRRTA